MDEYSRVRKQGSESSDSNLREADCCCWLLQQAHDVELPIEHGRSCKIARKA